MFITTTRNLLTGSWNIDVEKLETAIRRFKPDGTRQTDCHVAFFEIARDRDLHVNVTHAHETVAVSGWDGPAKLSEGFVHNRRFGGTALSQIVQHIRDMVFAAPA
jgi:hypothetical protein